MIKTEISLYNNENDEFETDIIEINDEETYMEIKRYLEEGKFFIGNDLYVLADEYLIAYKSKNGYNFIRTLELNKKYEEYKTCIECGKEFGSNHGNQKFCPPKEGNKRSTCENRYNQRLKRQRKKEKEETPLK